MTEDAPDKQPESVSLLDVPPRVDWVVYSFECSAAVAIAIATAWQSGLKPLGIFVAGLLAYGIYTKGFFRDARGKFKGTRKTDDIERKIIQ